MDKTTAILIALGIAAIVVLAFFAVFRYRGKFTIKTKLVEVSAEGENAPPAVAPTTTDSVTVNAQQISAGRNVITGKEIHIHEAPTALKISSLHQLPSPPANFTGRDDELAELERKLTADRAAGATISGARAGLQGMGGDRKSVV